MSYQIGNGSLYVGNVKWSTDNANVMLFASNLDTDSAKASGKTARDNFLKSHLTKIKSNVIWYDPNTYVDIKGRIKSVDNVNYCFYIPDPDILDISLCCFVTNYEYMSANTTRLYLKLDTWQTYIYSTNLYQSYIERAIVSISDNNSNINYLPEPINASLEYEKQLDVIGIGDDNKEKQKSWQPIWVLHSASYYEYSTQEYHYEGIGTHNSYGEYGRFINSKQELKDLIKNYGRDSMKSVLSRYGSATTTLFDNIEGWLNDLVDPDDDNTWQWQKIQGASTLASMQDHRDELIGLYAIPKWLYDTYISIDGNNPNYADNQRVVTDDIPLTLNTSHLANGYQPRNKKLLTSVCRGYVLANRTGLKIPFKPELFSGNASIILGGITMSTSGYQYTIDNYDDDQQAHGEVAYNSERRVGYDANTGINKALNILTSGAQLGQSVGGLMGSVMSKNPLTIASGVADVGASAFNAIDKIGQREAHFGNNGDLLRITDSRPVLRWFEINPSLSECRAIDDFFDMFGYTINRHANIKNYINKTSVRPEWSYIKTQNADLRVQAPADYEQEIKGIFNSGVRIWFNYDNYCDYSVNNRQFPNP